MLGWYILRSAEPDRRRLDSDCYDAVTQCYYGLGAGSSDISGKRGELNSTKKYRKFEQTYFGHRRASGTASNFAIHVLIGGGMSTSPTIDAAADVSEDGTTNVMP